MIDPTRQSSADPAADLQPNRTSDPHPDRMRETQPDPTIGVGDVVVDCAAAGTGYVVDLVAYSVAEFDERSDWGASIAAAGPNPLFAPAHHEPVWAVVPLPAGVASRLEPAYAVPDSRLVRYPVEAAGRDLRRVQDGLVVDVLTHLFVAAGRADPPVDRTALAEIAVAADVPHDLLDAAMDHASAGDGR